MIVVLLLSCSKDILEEHPSTLPTPTEGKVNIVFDLEKSDFHKPVNTKSADFDLPQILSFQISGTDTIYIEKATAIQAGAKYIAQLTESSSQHLLLFISNADDLLNEKEVYLQNKSYREVIEILSYGDPLTNGLSNLNNPTPIPFVTSNIPMRYKCIVDQINGGMNLGTIYLQRIVSKIYVDASTVDISKNFNLTALSILDIPSKGVFDNEISNAMIADLTSYETLADIQNNTTLNLSEGIDRPVYAHVFNKDSRQPLFLILEANFGKENRYFKMMIGGENQSYQFDSQNMSLLINITDINSIGYATMEQAIANEPESSISVTVDFLDDTHEVAASGKYYLGLTNSEFHFYADEAYSDVLVSTITTNVFDNPIGNIPDVKLTIENISGDITIAPGVSINSNNTDLKLDFGSSATGEAIVCIEIGNLQKKVTVKKHSALNNNYTPGSNGFFLGDQYKSLSVIEAEKNTGFGKFATDLNRYLQLNDLQNESAYVFIHNQFSGETITKLKGYTISGNAIRIENRKINNPTWLYLDSQGKLNIGQFGKEVDPDNMMFFKFGSVIGMTNDGTPWQLDLSQIKFNPSNLSINSANGDIRIFSSGSGKDLPSIPCVNDLIDTLTHNISSSLYHNASNIKSQGKGDPCKLIGLSANEIKNMSEADLDAYQSGYRLPTHNENIDFIGAPVSYYDNFASTFFLEDINTRYLSKNNDGEGLYGLDLAWFPIPGDRNNTVDRLTRSVDPKGITPLMGRRTPSALNWNTAMVIPSNSVRSDRRALICTEINLNKIIVNRRDYGVVAAYPMRCVRSN